MEQSKKPEEQKVIKENSLEGFEDETCYDEDVSINSIAPKVFGINNRPREEKINLVVLCHGF
jgi:hypothetical protein